MARKPKEPTPPKCVECGKVGILTTGERIYPHRRDLWSKSFWRCECGAYVGCHGDTDNPLGYCAGPETRKARNFAHAVFDPLWKIKMQTVVGCTQKQARNAAYLWLSTELDIPGPQCHISMMTAADCRRVYALCKPIHDRVKGALRS